MENKDQKTSSPNIKQPVTANSDKKSSGSQSSTGSSDSSKSSSTGSKKN